jgi:hypothetical protein
MNPGATSVETKSLGRLALAFAYPALRKLPNAEWDRVLEQAREGSFDTMEWMGIVAGVAFATYLLHIDADQAMALSLPVRYFVQFIAAVPLLTLTVGPFYLRRTRRGLDQEIERRDNHGPAQQTR